MRALVIGASGGIGAAVATALAARGAEVVGLSRSGDGLDVTDEASVAAHLGAQEGAFDLIFVATGALEIGGARPEKTIRDLTPGAMADQFALNCIGPAMVLKHGLALLPRDRRAVFAVLSARVGSIGDNRLGGWYAYRTAKAAVNQVVHSAAIELARTHSKAICVALHPGTVATEFTRDYLGRHPSVTPGEAADNLLSVIDGLTPEDTGGFRDWAGKAVVW
ncbi:MAG: SDR family NAD(P)-dependent oxidoreductase [Rhodobacteraceae bacterium]|nr:MAG: SDR family NAD(P)-dependent oxidoreductase [Paracoccaceae bacterium]